MNKNFWIVLLIFIIPVCAYWTITRNQLAPLPSVASEGDIVIKFSSPMCYECQELEQVFEEIFPKYDKDVQLNRVDVTQKDNNTKSLIKEYDVKLVPTTVLINQDGRIIRKFEGCVTKGDLEKYLKELIDG